MKCVCKHYLRATGYVYGNKCLKSFLVFDKCFSSGCLTDPLLLWISWDAIFVAVAACLVAFIAVSFYIYFSVIKLTKHSSTLYYLLILSSPK